MSTAAPPAHWQLWCDGTATPNPGRTGLGAVLVSPALERHALSTTGECGCNNAAELQAMIHGLRAAHALGARHIHIYSDSDFVVGHVRDARATSITRLATLIDQARAECARFDHWQLTWIPRHRNGEADTLARASLGLPAKPATRPISAKRRR